MKEGGGYNVNHCAGYAYPALVTTNGVPVAPVMRRAGLIETGSPRHVTGHVVSGALAAGVVAVPQSALQLVEGKMIWSEALLETGLRMVQGGIAAGSAISATNHLGAENGWLRALASFGAGIAGIYATERVRRLLAEVREQEQYRSEGEQL